MFKDTERSSAALYDGGWRAGDREELMKEYELTEDEATIICVYLRTYELKEEM